MSFCVAGARDCAPSQKWAKRDGFVMAGVGLLKQAFGYPQLPDPLSLSARPQTRELTCQPPSESKIWALWRHVDWRMSACETTLHPEAMAVQSNVWVHKRCRPDDKKRHGRPANTQADAIRHRIEPQTLYNALSWLEVGQCQSSPKSKCTKHLSFGALFEVAMSKKMHAVAARSTCRSQNVRNTSALDRFWKLRCRKSAPRCGAKRISRSKCLFSKKSHVRNTFGRSDAVSRGRRKGLCTLSKVNKKAGFCSISTNDGRRGTFQEDLQRCILRGRRSTRDMFIRAIRRSGRWFPEKGRILEHQIFRFAEMILRHRCSASYVLAPLFFPWQAQCFRQVEWKNLETWARGR